MPEITRLDLVQGDARTLELHAYASHPTGGATQLEGLLGATAYFRMRHAKATALVASIAATVANASLGQILVPLATMFTATAGQWRAQLTIDRGALGVVTVPADEPYLVVIRERV